MTPEWLESNLAILPQLLVNSVITGSIYALASCGLALTYGITHVLNFAHGHLMMVGAYCFLGFFSILGFTFFPAILFSLLALVAIGAISYLVFVRPFEDLNPLLPFVTTLSLGAILEAGVSLIFGVNVRSFSSGDFATSWSLGSIYITPLQVLIIALALLLLVSLAILVHVSRWGRTIRALSSKHFSAESLGINRKRYLVCSFVLGVVLAGIAGVLIGFETNLQPTMGSSYTIKAFAAMILGGLGNIWGTVLGAYLLGFVENFAIGIDFAGFSLPAGYRDAFAFLLILATLLFRPQGLLGFKARNI